MNALIVFASVIAAASAGLLGAPVGVGYAGPIGYGGVGQVSTAAGLATGNTQSLRISQSARPVAYAAAAPVAYAQQAIAAAPVAYAQPAVAAVAAPAYASYGHTQAGLATGNTQSLRISQSARPIGVAGVGYAAPVGLGYAAPAVGVAGVGLAGPAVGLGYAGAYGGKILG